MPPKPKATKKKSERRQYERKDVADTFQLFLVIGGQGQQKVYLRDVSEGGIGFVVENANAMKAGDKFEADFYVNPSLKIPLSFRVAHVTNSKEFQRIGCEFRNKTSKAYRVYLEFVELLDSLVEFL